MEELASPTLRNINTGEMTIINNFSFSIGRSVSCDLVLQSLQVSRLQCTIKKLEDHWELYDNSTNGTFVDNSLIMKNQKSVLINGARITFNQTMNQDGFVFNDSSYKPNENEMIIIDDTIDNTIQTDEPSVVYIEDIREDPSKPKNDDTAIDINKHIENTANIEDNKVCETKPEQISPTEEEKSRAREEEENTKKQADMDIIDTELTCIICSEIFIKALTINCAHTFCEFCINQWMKSKKTCPICRQNIKNVSKTIVLDNYIERKLEMYSDEVKSARREVIKQREDIATAGGSGVKITKKNYDVITIDDEDDDNEEMDDDDDNSMHDFSYDEYDSWNDEMDDNDDFDDNDEYDDTYSTPYNGVPGAYFGGHGRCYICNQSGHWANGCPVRQR